MKFYLHRWYFWFFSVLIFVSGSTLAEVTKARTTEKPVAIVSMVDGQAWVKSKGSTERTQVYWLTPLQPQDILETEADSKLTVTFFHDRTKWRLSSEAMAKVELDKLSGEPVFGTRIKRLKTEVANNQFGIPDLLVRPLSPSDFPPPDKEQAGLFMEDVHLTAYVDTAVYPPVFHWAPNGLSDYELSLFDESGQFLHSFKLKSEDFAYPAHSKAPFRMTKGQVYKWQVTDVDNNILVGKYPFAPLTQLHTKEIQRYQKALTSSDKTTYVDLLLVLAEYGALDKYLHLLQKMAEIDANNPELQNALARAYLERGAPQHALKALEWKAVDE